MHRNFDHQWNIEKKKSIFDLKQVGVIKLRI